jgi:2-aminoadipate transaminase
MHTQLAARLANVEASAIRELFKLLAQPGIISFAGGFPDSSTFDLEGIREASARALSQGPSLQYGATEGYEPLREALAASMGAKGAESVQAQDLIVTTGSQQAIDLVAKALIDPGDRVIVEAPTFLSTIQAFRMYGAQLVGAPVDAHGVVPDKLERLIEQHRPKFIYLIPTFGNPTGAVLDAARRRRVLELAVKHQTIVVEDDPYGELYFDAPPPPTLRALAQEIPGAHAHVVYCGSLSKILSPGLRIGWLNAPPDLLRAATLCKQFSDAHTSTYAQVTAAEYLAAGRMPATIERARRTYAERAQAMAASLDEALGTAIEFHAPRGGLFLWARLTGRDGGSTNASEFARTAIEHRVAFVPGAPFYAADPDHSRLRLSFATAPVDVIHEGIRRLGEARRAAAVA